MGVFDHLIAEAKRESERRRNYATGETIENLFQGPLERLVCNCGCRVVLVLHTGEVACGKCGPPDRTIGPEDVRMLALIRKPENVFDDYTLLKLPTRRPGGPCPVCGSWEYWQPSAGPEREAGWVCGGCLVPPDWSMVRGGRLYVLTEKQVEEWERGDTFDQKGPRWEWEDLDPPHRWQCGNDDCDSLMWFDQWEPSWKKKTGGRKLVPCGRYVRYCQRCDSELFKFLKKVEDFKCLESRK